jgi:hypothetical protein
MTTLGWSIIAALGLAGLVGLAWLAVEVRRGRAQPEVEPLTPELLELARRQAIADARAADQRWNALGQAHNPILYVRAGQLRAVTAAAGQRALAIRALIRTGQPVNAPTLPDEWQPPRELRDSRDDRPLPDRWGRFDRAVKALTAIATTADADPGAVADAHAELARAAGELAGELENAALEHKRSGGEVLCSFCGKPNTEVKRMIAGPGINICDDCIELCVEIIEDPDQT